MLQFVFNTVRALETGPGRYLEDSLVKNEAYVGYFDPFDCECRAYGRLQQERREDLAVCAHGYLFLTPEQERAVTAVIDGDSLDLPDPAYDSLLVARGIWGRHEEHRGQFVRAIVKDLIEDCEPFEEDQAPQLWHDMEALHSVGILVRDIHMGNYMGGKLVDFSLAWTMYHPALDRISDHDIHGFQRNELNNLEQMMYDVWNWHQSWEIEIPAEFTPLTVGERSDETGTDPRDYDWRQWEENATEAERYVAEDLFWPYED